MSLGFTVLSPESPRKGGTATDLLRTTGEALSLRLQARASRQFHRIFAPPPSNGSRRNVYGRTEACIMKCEIETHTAVRPARPTFTWNRRSRPAPTR